MAPPSPACFRPRPMEPTPSRIETVTLYQAGASVRRLAEVTCPQGQLPQEVELAGLPLSLVDANVRVRVVSVQPAVEVVAGAVRLGLHVPPRGAPPEAPDVAELRQARQALAVAVDALNTLEGEVSLLRALPVPERPTGEDGKPPPPSPMLARLALEQVADEGIAARITRIRALRAQVETLSETVADQQRKVALATDSRKARPDELTRSITVRLVAPAGVRVEQLTLEVEYFVRAARWAPAYQCRMSRDCTKAELHLRAMVWQRSGEDWTRARLWLSTAQPLQWTELPELSALRIGKAQPPPPARAGFRPPPTGADLLFADHDTGLSVANAQRPVIPSWQPPALEGLEPLPELPAAAEGFGSFSQRAASSGAVNDDDGSGDKVSMMADMAMEEEAAPEPMTPPRMQAEMARRSVASGPPMRPPPMPSMAPPAPAPAAAPMRVMAKKSAAPARGMAMEKERSMSRDEASLGEEGEVETAVPGYLQLELGAPVQAGLRARLHPVDQAAEAFASLAQRGALVEFDALARLREAAATGFQEPPPLGYRSGLSDLSGSFDFVYRTEARVDVPSDGGWHSVPVHQRSATANVLYVAVPREDSHVYREAMVKNPLPAPMLSGPVDVYVADEYVLSTTLPTVAPGGDFKLGLGVEQAIKVARNTRFSEKRSGEKVVAMQDLQHDIEIELSNRLDREVKCEVRERIPQPAPDAEVVVEEADVKPAWETYTQAERRQVLEGGRKWTVTLKSGQTQALSARYVVKLYANNELVGGNRREA